MARDLGYELKDTVMGFTSIGDGANVGRHFCFPLCAYVGDLCWRGGCGRPDCTGLSFCPLSTNGHHEGGYGSADFRPSCVRRNDDLVLQGLSSDFEEALVGRDRLWTATRPRSILLLGILTRAEVSAT